MDGKSLYWAGFYWRNNEYPIPFLKEVCELCQRTNVGKISFTPWKTFVVKDIEANHKIYWDELIGRYGINMRHSSFELNWHLPLLDQKALKLKRYLVSEFDKFDIRTFGLSFAIQNKPGERFTTVVIRPKSRLPFLGKFDFTRTYSIEHAYDFNPNNNHYLEYATNLGKNQLPQALRELSKRYYARLFAQNTVAKVHKQDGPKRSHQVVYQCPDCLTVYDERYGDALADITSGTPFDQLPDSYCCQVCDTPKTAFAGIKILETVS
jgi:rubredoxin